MVSALRAWRGACWLADSGPVHEAESDDPGGAKDGGGGGVDVYHHTQLPRDVSRWYTSYMKVLVLAASMLAMQGCPLLIVGAACVDALRRDTTLVLPWWNA